MKEYLGYDVNKEFELFSSDRHTKIRSEKLNLKECGADFNIQTHLGVNVITDSEKLAKEIEIAVKDFNDCGSGINVDFVYLTKNLIPKNEESEVQARQISFGILGDLVVDKTFSQYALSGPDKFGSAESVIFGIYSFERAKKGFLGLHGAQIYDRKNGVSHIITGDSGIGKSTFGQLLENRYPGRFTLLSDDWIELDSKLKSVQPISSTFGSRIDTHADKLININPRIKDGFTSFGKNFYTYESDVVSMSNIGEILFLHNANQISENTVTDQLIDSNKHIPFLSDFKNKTQVLPLGVVNNLENLVLNLNKLTRKDNFCSIELKTNDIEKNLAIVLNKFN